MSTADPPAPFAVIGMFPYPSGRAHLGHVRVYTITSVRARHARRKGDRSVMHPIGWDAFGLPAEQAAIARGVDPAAWTADNIARMRSTFDALAFGFDADREIDTSSPSYHRWTQWLFLLMVRRGLAAVVDGWVNWCPSCATTLADEQVADGLCWRCSAPAERRRRPQWVFRITRYAEALWHGLDGLVGWDPAAVAVQRNWIRRSQGAAVRFAVTDASGRALAPVEAFTTRPDTLFGVTAVVVAPEHPLATASDDPAVAAYVREALVRPAVARQSEAPTSGARLALTASHPITGEPLPVFVADYVVGDYGTGAVMCVPAHDARDAAFAAVVGLPTHSVVDASGALVASGAYDGLSVADAGPRIAEALRERGAGGPEVRFRLRDWSVSRQRRWGCPIPMVTCPACGTLPVPEAELPVLLDAPAERPCPSCGGAAVRDPDTLDTFVCSAWYLFRYCDPRATDVAFHRDAVDRWAPFALYVGGIEHAAQHMLYLRFVTRVLRDAGLVGCDEPVARFVCNGMVLGADGRKMSKSRGNGVDPTALIARFGADALRLAVLADLPVERDLAWTDDRAASAARFLARMDRALTACPSGRGEVTPTRTEAWPDQARVTRLAELFAALDRELTDNQLHNAVARAHELGAELRAVLAEHHREPGAAAAAVRDVLIAIHPLVPGWVEARWAETYGAIDAFGWPAPRSAPVAVRAVVVQVDGRTVGTVTVPSGAGEDVVWASAIADARIAARLVDRVVSSVVFVPDRLINLRTRVSDRSGAARERIAGRPPTE